MRIPDGDLMPARRHRYGGGYGRRRRRRLRQFAVLAALVLVVTGVALWIGQDNKPAVRDTLAPCPTPAASTAPLGALQPAQVRLTVLNGTPRNGLAQQVGAQLLALHFVVLRKDNAPAAVAGPSVVTYGAGGLPAATLLARYVPGARVVSGPRAAAGSVQLVLGGDFTRLATPQEVSAAQAAASSPRPVVNPRRANCRS